MSNEEVGSAHWRCTKCTCSGSGYLPNACPHCHKPHTLELTPEGWRRLANTYDRVGIRSKAKSIADTLGYAEWDTDDRLEFGVITNIRWSDFAHGEPCSAAIPIEMFFDASTISRRLERDRLMTQLRRARGLFDLVTRNANLAGERAKAAERQAKSTYANAISELRGAKEKLDQAEWQLKKHLDGGTDTAEAVTDAVNTEAP